MDLTTWIYNWRGLGLGCTREIGDCCPMRSMISGMLFYFTFFGLCWWHDYIFQSFPYENHCKCYKKLAWRLWPVLFTLTDFFLLHTLSSSTGKKKVVLIAVFLSKLDHRPLFNDIYYETILVWGFVSVLLANATHSL